MILALVQDPDTVSKVAAAAERFRWEAVFLKPGQQSMEEISQYERARLLVVDLDEVAGSGPEFYRGIQRSADLLVLVVGNLTDGTSAGAALRAGADCCLPKPVDLELLEAQIEALLRRRARYLTPPDAVTVRGLTVDFGRKEVRLHENPVPVTPGEYRLLACLAGRVGKVVSSPELLKEIGGYECPPSEAQEIVKVHVSRLRSKIDLDPTRPSYLLNVRGFGYMLERRGARDETGGRTSPADSDN